MDRSRIWPDFREAWVVFEDPDLLAVDKPVGVTSQAADPQHPDDLVTRLKRYLAAREGTPDAYLGVHQRLDRDTSGVLLYARRREANAGLATQFEGRSVRKTYVACVAGWPEARAPSRPARGAKTHGGRPGQGGASAGAAEDGRRTLRDSLAPDRDGKMRVAAARERGATPAVTHVRVLGRKGPRAMLELELETGRTHQARVQLANAGAPIAGDVAYGGPPAPRLLLHARSLALHHPATGKPIRFEAPLPPEFDAWLAHGDPGAAVYDDGPAVDRALARALERRWGLGRSEGGARETTAFRLVNEEGDGLPGLAVDAYGGWLVAQLYPDDRGERNRPSWADPAAREAVLDRLQALGFDGVYLKVRPRQANVVVDTRREDLAPKLPVRGAPAPDDLVIVEESMPLLVRLGDGLSTGLFLDQRNNRRRVRETAAGASVANLFAYTCAFSVAAALGGAKKTVSVDASVVALERGRSNLERAGVEPLDAHSFVVDDVFAWLARAARHGERFDLVVLDPPSYSTTKRGRFVADSDYAGLAASALAILSPRGRLLACTNHRGISPDKFRRILFDAARAADREVAQIKDLPEPADFPAAPGSGPHMKAAMVTLGAPPAAPSSRRSTRRA
ncbi:MAG TPA: class I SAM-dependent methyltransferase [Polyangiaceae bacterium]|jgi:23S rRNA (cytosine1962-C5)-methyltransferase|nr:class I SAM-dependent methyltransferase [Polyangiaceae bacterium]